MATTRASKKAQQAGLLEDGDHWLSRGCYLRVRWPNASFVFRYASPVHGKRREMGLGVCDTSSIEVVRAQQEEVIRRVVALRRQVAEGRDPIDERERENAGRKVEQMRALGITVRHLLRLWARDSEKRRNWSYRYSQEVYRGIEQHPPAWFLDIPIDDLTAQDTLRALEEMTCSQERKDNFRQRLDWAMEWFIHEKRLKLNAAGVRRIVRGRFVAEANV